MFDGNPSPVGRCVPVQPLFTGHRGEWGGKRSGEACEEDDLDPDSRVGKVGPFWKLGSVATKGSVVGFVDEKVEKTISSFGSNWRWERIL